jgi:hypothetical protein
MDSDVSSKTGPDQANFSEVDITFSPIVGEGAAAHRIARVGDAFTFDVPCSDNEPRIRDLDLAEKLGFKEPRAIRKLIKRYEKAGDLPCIHVRDTVSRTSMPRGGEREETIAEYWLTEAEALFILAKSETPRAKALLQDMIAVVRLVRRGLLRMSANDNADVTQAIVRLTATVEKLVVGMGTMAANVTDLTARVVRLEAAQSTAAANDAREHFIGRVDARRHLFNDRLAQAKALARRIAPGSVPTQRTLARRFVVQIDADVRRRLGMGNQRFENLPRAKLPDAVNAFRHACDMLTAAPHALTGETFEQPSLFDQHDLAPRRKAAGSPN